MVLKREAKEEAEAKVRLLRSKLEKRDDQAAEGGAGAGELSDGGKTRQRQAVRLPLRGAGLPGPPQRERSGAQRGRVLPVRCPRLLLGPRLRDALRVIRFHKANGYDHSQLPLLQRGDRIQLLDGSYHSYMEKRSGPGMTLPWTLLRLGVIARGSDAPREEPHERRGSVRNPKRGRPRAGPRAAGWGRADPLGAAAE